MAGIAASAIGFGIVFGLTARGAGFSLVEAIAFSTLVFAGASQFAAAGMVAAGFGWAAIVLLTALVNARHLLYAAALAPWLRGRPRRERAAMAHVLTDESFALSLVHFHRLGFADRRGYWIAAVGGVFIPWNAATIVGHLGGQVIPDPAALGLDVVFPAAMAGLAVGLAGGRREVVALAAGAAIALAVALLVDPRVGVVVGGVLGPLAGLAVPRRHGRPPVAVEPAGDPAAPAGEAPSTAPPGGSDGGPTP
jgi:4-azaleucine resistance transporter AzlC